MTEEEVKALEEKLNSREKKLKDYENTVKGRVLKLKPFFEKGEVLRVLDESNIKTMDDLNAILNYKEEGGAKEKTEKKEEQDMGPSKEEVKGWVKEALQEGQKDTAEFIEQQKLTQVQNQLKSSLEEFFKKEENIKSHPIAAKFFKNSPNEAVDNYVSKLQQDSDLSVENFSEGLNTQIESIARSAELIEEKEKEKTGTTIMTEEGNKSSTIEGTGEKTSEKEPQDDETKLKSNIEQALAMTEKGIVK